MSKNKNNPEIQSKFAGNFTLGAVTEFKKHIVNETDYLEKVDYLRHIDINKK